MQILTKFFILIWVVFIPMKTSYYQISAVLIMIMFFIEIFKKKDFYPFFIRYLDISKTFSIIVFIMILSNILNHITALNSWIVIFQYVFRYFFIFIIFLYFYEKKIISKKFLLVAVLISLSIQALDGSIQAIYNYDLFKHNLGSLNTGLTGGTSNRNIFGAFMAIGSSIMLGIIFYKNKFKLTIKYTILGYILMLLFQANLLFSYSRASWLFHIVFIICIFAFDYKKIKLSYLYLLFLSGIFFFVLFYFDPSLSHRLNQLLNGYSSHRFEIWKNAITFIKKSPIIGYGIMSYKSIGAPSSSVPYVTSIHNSIFEILFFVGFLGLVAFTNMLYKIFKIVLKFKNKMYISLFFACLTITQFDQSIIKSITFLSSLAIFSFFIFSKKTDNTILIKE